MYFRYSLFTYYERHRIDVPIDAYALSQLSGSKIWDTKIGTGGLVQNFGAPAVADGKVFLYGGGLCPLIGW